jgi:23S rRNA (guanine745-N1)-methyltransferase
MLPEVVRHLRCPVCRAALSQAAPTAPLRCRSGHSFDPARQGYVQLTNAPLAHPGDSAAMVAARGTFLAAGHYTPITTAVREAAAPAWPGGLVLDVGAGTGRYLADVLDAVPAAWGLALDASKAAARRAASAHPRAAVVVADAWRPFPLADHCVGVLTDVFAPRNAVEFARVLRPDGALVVVTPAADHLTELVDALGLLTVDPAKTDRLAGTLGATFHATSTRRYRWDMELNHDAVGTLVAMGPSAWHTDPAALAPRIAALPALVSVTASVLVGIHRPR